MLKQLSFSYAHFRFFYSCFQIHRNHLDPTWDIMCLLLKHIFSRAIFKDKISMSLEAYMILHRLKPHSNECVEEGRTSMFMSSLKIYWDYEIRNNFWHRLKYSVSIIELRQVQRKVQPSSHVQKEKTYFIATAEPTYVIIKLFPEIW